MSIAHVCGVKPRACTALDAHAEQFDTYDGDLIALSGTIGNPPLLISPPNVPEPLF